MPYYVRYERAKPSYNGGLGPMMPGCFDGASTEYIRKMGEVWASHRASPPTVCFSDGIWHWFRADTEEGRKVIDMMEELCQIQPGFLVRFDSITPPGDKLWEDKAQAVFKIPKRGGGSA